MDPLEPYFGRVRGNSSDATHSPYEPDFMLPGILATKVHTGNPSSGHMDTSQYDTYVERMPWRCTEEKGVSWEKWHSGQYYTEPDFKFDGNTAHYTMYAKPVLANPDRVTVRDDTMTWEKWHNEHAESTGNYYCDLMKMRNDDGAPLFTRVPSRCDHCTKTGQVECHHVTRLSKAREHVTRYVSKTTKHASNQRRNTGELWTRFRER
jgi:hypothetical protein